MSEWSYQRNVRLGVTGCSTLTCLPAAFERISDESLPPDIYVEYKRFMSWYDDRHPYTRRLLNPCTKEVYSSMAWHLGGLDFSAFEFYAIDNFSAFQKTIKSLVTRECRIVLSIDYSPTNSDDEEHAMGVIPTEDPDLFKLVSTHTPRSLQGLVCLETIFDHLVDTDINPSALYPFNDTNVTALPLAA